MKTSNIHTKNALIIVPSGGLNDALNQLHRALGVAKNMQLVPTVFLEMNQDYGVGLEEILDCSSLGLVPKSEFKVHVDFPTFDEIQSMSKSQPRNTAIKAITGDFIYFGKGGGIIGSSKILSKCDLSPTLKDEMELAVAKTNLQTPAIHLRCSDVSPDIAALQRIDNRIKNGTVYSDCRQQDYFRNQLSEGYSASDHQSRSSSDLISLLLISRHESVALVPLKNMERNTRMKFSGFGLLALTMHLRRVGIKALFNSVTRQTLLNLLRRDQKMFVGVILASVQRVK